MPATSELNPPKPEPTWLTILRLLRWDKPTGRLILMIPALWAVVLATRGLPPLPLVIVIVLGTLTTSAAGCVVNDLWDRNIDPQVRRTRHRPLASRALSIQVGIGVALAAFICAALLAFYLNPWTNPLSFWLCVAAVPVIIGYPLAKRVFPLPQLVLAIAWGFAVLISWSAAIARLEPATWLLWAATILWTLGFDTVYAMSDRDDDRRLGIRSSALFFGRYAAAAVALFFCGTALLLAGLGMTLHLHLGFWLALAIAGVTWLWQSWHLQRRHLPAQTYAAIFRQNVWIGFVILLGMITGLLL
ncbi:4-hydroxybenzoate polyprenyltransferase [Neosynechococcus sphagnicola sy1]|uniref:4-hydroxybenzoate solanesyltransferase n=1 Tax=Neosynechococcus sphagnicola sy1 TaxID=1497020 RepID=A0A098TIV6_9CYAN|nr:4-hydroxybenzoate solanesyltransferase [Neosynechococcus sphagnicola]KGF71922.1 4-hydroxybenzoate polyprenyltransferase [Neosynechococcus sphagnicola sy1]